MTTVGLNIRQEARPGKEDDVADLLRRGLAPRRPKALRGASIADEEKRQDE